MQEKIPCTVGMVVRNGGSVLPRALASVQDFAEIILCDGRSTDDTREVAARYGAKVIEQDARYLQPDGRIKDFGAIWNQVRDAGRYPWFFCFCADEYITPELVEEIRRVVAGEPAIYWMRRKYIHLGKIIDCAITYPNQQYRVFHTAVAGRYIKEIHEHVEVLPGVVPKVFKESMLVDIEDTAGELIAKWRRYIKLEVARRSGVTFRWWLRMALHEVGVAGLYVLRMLRLYATCKGNRLPISFDLARLWYQFAVPWALLRAVRRF